jgi:NAD-dependent dihydropyrimidine dehydrogenase PreA subunit
MENKIMSKKPAPVIEINQAWCKGCVICVKVCPKNVLAMSGVYPIVVAIDSCNACGLCEVLCPDFAITVKKADQSTVNQPEQLKA